MCCIYSLNVYQKERCCLALTAFKTAVWKIVLEYDKCNYGQALEAKVAKKLFGSREFWKVSNQIMIGGKAVGPTK